MMISVVQCFSNVPILLNSLFIELYYLVFWLKESCYSEVEQAKIVEPKEPSVGDTVIVKEGTKVHTGKVVGSGNEKEIENMMTEFTARDGEEDKEPEETVGSEQGTK